MEDRIFKHDSLPQEANKISSEPFSFVIGADTQLGMSTSNASWEVELATCRRAVSRINGMDPKPSFVCICGDLVDMEKSFFSKTKFSNAMLRKYQIVSPKVDHEYT